MAVGFALQWVSKLTLLLVLATGTLAIIGCGSDAQFYDPLEPPTPPPNKPPVAIDIEADKTNLDPATEPESDPVDALAQPPEDIEDTLVQKDVGLSEDSETALNNPPKANGDGKSLPSE